MIRVDVWCQNEDCEDLFRYSCEHEEGVDQSEHSAKCPLCLETTVFNITYEPVAFNERKPGVEK